MKICFLLFFTQICFLTGGRLVADHIETNTSLVVKKDTATTDFFKRTTGCIAGDAGYSVKLSGNKVLWLMGDSHIDDYDKISGTVPCLFQVRNTAMLQPLNDWKATNTITLTGTKTGLKSYLKNRVNDSFFIWPGGAIEIKNRLYIYCNSLMNQGSGAFGFAASGNDMVAITDPLHLSDISYQHLPFFNGINFGTGFISDREGKWIYAYGQKYLAKKMTCELYLARFSADQPFKDWQFWNGRQWNKDVAAAAVIASQAGVSGTFHISRVKNKILLLSSQLSINCDSGTGIYAATANDFAGPFTDKQMIWSIDNRLNGHTPFFYAAIAHPEYINQSDELLITYAINGYGTCVPDCNNNRMNPDVYRLNAIRVPCGLLTY